MHRGTEKAESDRNDSETIGKNMWDIDIEIKMMNPSCRLCLTNV